MGKVNNPSLSEKENLRRSFFRETGNRYFDELEKLKEERRRRIPSRTVATETVYLETDPGQFDRRQSGPQT